MLFLLSLSSPSPNPFSFSSAVRAAGVSCLLAICTPSTCPSDPMFCSFSYFSPPLFSFLTSHCPLALFHCNISKHLLFKNCTLTLLGSSYHISSPIFSSFLSSLKALFIITVWRPSSVIPSYNSYTLASVPCLQLQQLSPNSLMTRSQKQ